MSIASVYQVPAAASEAPPASHPIRKLPLVILYLSERCNSRCVSCDYWRHGSVDMNVAFVSTLLPELAALQTKTVLISGGEPLLNPDWPQIAELLRSQGLALWLLTSGLSLSKHVSKVERLFHQVTVSLDGTDRDTYKAIRGLDAFDTVCEGIRKSTDAGIRVGLRVTVQRDNYRQLHQFVQLARKLRVREISFLAADVANPHVFGRDAKFTANVALRPEDLPILDQVFRDMEHECAREFASGLIAEKPEKLRRIWQYYSAICGRESYPPVRCNAPEFSAVVESDGRIRPCFFISGPTETGVNRKLGASLNAGGMTVLRSEIRAGHRAECATCVCSMWREGGGYA